MTFRSSNMSCCDLFLQPEAAFHTLSRLGDMGCCEFADMNRGVSAYEKHYMTEVCRLYILENKLKFIYYEIRKEHIYIPYPEIEPAAILPHEMVNYENLIEKWDYDIIDISHNQFNLLQDLLEMREMRYLLTQIGPFLGDADVGTEAVFPIKKNTGFGDIGKGGRLVVVTGIVSRKKAFAFELMLWRIARGNIFYREAPNDEVLTDPKTGDDVRKVAFLAVCQGEQLGSRMEKVMNGFKVNIYPCPDTVSERQDTLNKVQTRIINLEEVLEKSRYYRCKALRTVSRQWRNWMIKVRKAKAIYHIMNQFTIDITKNCLIGQCWIPDYKLKNVQQILDECSALVKLNVPCFMSKTETDEKPPTFHRTNRFTRGFQAVIDAYGEAKYKEVNAAQFTVVTFPFLFGVMFGDMGHGLILIFFSTWMIIMENKYMGRRGSEIWDIFFGGRYVILLLGLFSFFTGFVYNDIFSKSINFSESMWMNTKSISEISREEIIELDGRNRMRHPYPYGVDPIWQISKNKITMDNSIKMKLSITIGILHMLFGICLSVCNFVYFKRYHAIILQFIPEFLFLSCLFLWLVIMIYFKWFVYYDQHPDPRLGSACAPQLLILFIDMVLMSTTDIKIGEGCDIYLFSFQKTLQSILLLIALLCVPILLLGTPLYTHFVLKKKIAKRREKSDYETDFDEEDELPFSDLMIHQAIHTIEFVLSTVSHTASYLRLWALSLAHSQLSEMLWLMVLSKLGLQDHSTPKGAVKIFFAFAIWASFTLSVLVVMEGLSAFLHTLRLHWVEFMSKFYFGGGIAFQPFSFKALLATEFDKPEGACKSSLTKRERNKLEAKSRANLQQFRDI